MISITPRIVRSSVASRMLASASALVLVGLSAPAAAQGADTNNTSANAAADVAGKPPAGELQSEGGIQEIIVTAERRSARLQSVPISITAVTGAALEAAGIQDVTDLEQVTAGLVQPEGISGGPVLQPFIRGIGSTSTLPGIDASVALYIDGVFSGAKTLNLVDLANVERVEVLKGPQGTLYGRNAPGGAINIITQRPSDQFKGSASFSYGRFDETVEKFYVTGPLASGLAASLSVVGRQGGDFAENLTTGRGLGGLNTLTVNGQLAWDPTDRLAIDLTGTFARRFSDFQNNVGVQVGGIPPIAVQVLGGQFSSDPDVRYLNIDTVLKSRAYQGSVRVRYSLDNVDLVSITSYQRGTFRSVLDSDASTASFQSLDYVQPNRTFTQELQAVSTGDSAFQWILGAYYIRQKESYDPFTILLSRAISPTDLSYFSFQKADAKSVFGQATYEIAPETKVTAGLRYSTEKKSFDGLLVSPTFGGLVLSGPVSLDKTFNKLTWRFSVDHKLSTDVLAYASYNRGFKSGAFNPLSIDPALKPVSPEVLDAFEVGLKSQFLDRKVQLNAAAYYYDYKDIQVQRVNTGASASQAVLENAASATLYGLEAELVVVPIRSLQFNAGFNLEHSEYDSYPNASGLVPGNGTGTQVIIDYTGEQVLVAPKFSFNLSGSYELDVGPGKVLFAANYSRSSKFFTSPGTTNFQRAHGILNGSIAFTDIDDRYTIEVYGRNLTDEQKIGQYAGTTLNSFVLRTPLTYGVTVSTRF